MQLRLSASGRTAQQPRSYCTTLPCSKAQARYLSQNIGIDTNCKSTHAKENYSTGSGSSAHGTCVLRPAHIRPSAEASSSSRARSAAGTRAEHRKGRARVSRAAHHEHWHAAGTLARTTTTNARRQQPSAALNHPFPGGPHPFAGGRGS